MESEEKSLDSKINIKVKDTIKDDLVQASDMIRFAERDNAPAVVLCQRPSGNIFILRVKSG